MGIGEPNRSDCPHLGEADMSDGRRADVLHAFVVAETHVEVVEVPPAISIDECG
jgi:hypothetical protein